MSLIVSFNAILFCFCCFDDSFIELDLVYLGAILKVVSLIPTKSALMLYGSQAITFVFIVFVGMLVLHLNLSAMCMRNPSYHVRQS